jgi:hypothetical protein
VKRETGFFAQPQLKILLFLLIFLRGIIQALSEELDILPDNIVPSAEWLRRVSEFPGSADENPARGLVEFLEVHYDHMSCGGLIMDTANSREHSRTLGDAQPVGRDLVMKYIDDSQMVDI